MIPVAMLAAAIGGPKRNEATGGTYTTFTVGDETWARHIFRTSGTLSVVRGRRPFRVTVVGDGGSGGGAVDGFGANPGGRGGFHSADDMLDEGDHAVTVPAPPAGGLATAIGGAASTAGTKGGDVSLAGSFTAGGGHGGGGGIGPAGSTTNTVDGTGDPTPAADGGVTAIDYASHGLPSNVGTGGAASTVPYPGVPSGPGIAGAVVVEYRIV